MTHREIDRRRYRALQMLSEGERQADVCKALHVSCQLLRQWMDAEAYRRKREANPRIAGAPYARGLLWGAEMMTDAD